MGRFLGLVALIVVAGCAVRQSPRHLHDDRIPLGYTECVTIDEKPVPVSWVNLTEVGSPDERGVVVHEQKHKEQIARFRSCAAWRDHMQEHLAEIEAEAFCEDVKIELTPYPVALAKYADWLASSYPELQPLSVDSAAALIHKYCAQEE